MRSPGTVIAERFETIALAGRGGMGAVYRARDLRAGSTQDGVTLTFDDAWTRRQRHTATTVEDRLAYARRKYAQIAATCR